jgi:competence protein ComFB
MAELKNVVEELVRKELDSIYQRSVDVCKCDQCKNDIIALTLNTLPPQYATTRKNSEALTNTVFTKYYSKVTPAIMSAIEKVKKNPRPDCQKIKSNIYNPASTQQFLNFYQP